MEHPTGARLVAVLVVGIVAVQALMLFAFAWPASNTGPREVPVAVAGPPEVADQIEQGLAAVPSRDSGVPAFDVAREADHAAATEAITKREVYGAIVVTPDGPQALVASAASPAVAQLLRGAVAELSPEGASVPIQDVVPTTPDDPSGAGLGAGLLPLVMTSAAAGLIATVLLSRRLPRLVAVSALAVTAGIVGAALLEYGLGVVDGAYWPLAGVVALLVGAVAAAVAGLGAVLGRAGAALGVLLMIFLGNPLSAAAAGPEMLPQPWGDIGQLMPPGAAVSAVRSVAFFDGAAAGTPLLVLAVWLAAGLVLVAAGRSGRAVAERSEPTGAPGNVPDRGTSEARSGAGA
jgi:hypothetical protein